jgi:hypothetical protein
LKEVLKRIFGSKADAAQVVVDAVAEVTQPIDAQASNLETEKVDMATEVTNDGAALADVQAAAQAASEGFAATVASLTASLEAAQAKIAELTAQVEAAVEFKAAQEKAAAEAKVAARVAKLTEAVGEVQAAALNAATAALDDVAFEAVVTAVSAKATTEQASPAFKELGANGTTDATKLVADAQGSRVMDYLKTIAKETLTD